MSRIKLLLFGLLLVLVFENYSAFGQPSECINPPAGYTVGGSFDVSQWSCMDGIVVNSVKIKPTNIVDVTVDGYNFDYKGGAFNTLPKGTNEFTYTAGGTYWVLQVGTHTNGSKVIFCKALEIIKSEVPEIEANTCGPTQASLIIKDTPNNKKASAFRIDWGDGKIENIPNGTLPIQNISHVYSASVPIIQPKVLAIYVRGPNIEVCPSQPVFFNIGTSAAPKISELRGLNGGTDAKITMVGGNDGKEYQIQQKSSTGTTWTDTPIKMTKVSGQTTTTATVTGLNKSLEYCFRLLELNASCSIKNYSVNEVCTIVPTANVLSYQEVDLKWNHPTSPKIADLAKYTVRLTDQNNTAYPELDPKTSNFYPYNLMECGKKYKFSIEALYKAPTPNDVQVTIYSPEIEVIPNSVSKLPPKTIGTVSVLNASAIRVNIYEATGTLEEKYIFYKAESGSDNYTKIKETDDNFYEDLSVEPEKTQYCYKVQYTDKCGNESDLSPAFCSVFLTSKQANTLNWTPFVIPDPNNSASNGQQIEYFVEWVDENGLAIQSITRTSQTSADVMTAIDNALSDPDAKGRVTFRVNAVQRAAILVNGVITLFPFTVSSNTYTFITPAQIYVPNTFTPNGDSMNEIFIVQGRFISTFNMLIYDRWGKPIFESKNLNDGWNGTEVDGSTLAPPGNYAYKIWGEDTAGQKFEKIGSVLLLK